MSLIGTVEVPLTLNVCTRVNVVVVCMLPESGAQVVRDGLVDETLDL